MAIMTSPVPGSARSLVTVFAAGGKETVDGDVPRRTTMARKCPNCGSTNTTTLKKKMSDRGGGKRTAAEVGKCRDCGRKF